MSPRLTSPNFETGTSSRSEASLGSIMTVSPCSSSSRYSWAPHRPAPPLPQSGASSMLAPLSKGSEPDMCPYNTPDTFSPASPFNLTPPGSSDSHRSQTIPMTTTVQAGIEQGSLGASEPHLDFSYRSYPERVAEHDCEDVDDTDKSNQRRRSSSISALSVNECDFPGRSHPTPSANVDHLNLLLHPFPGSMVSSAPPRPPRRRSRTSLAISLSTSRSAPQSPTSPRFTRSLSRLSIPGSGQARSLSPSGDSIATITPSCTPTSRAIDIPSFSTNNAPTLACSIELGKNSLILTQNKRDSTQRRLGALRDLMPDLNLSQSWSNSDSSSGTPDPQTPHPDSLWWAQGSEEGLGRVAGNRDSTSSEDSSMIRSPASDLATTPARTRFICSERPIGIFEPDVDLSHVANSWPEHLPCVKVYEEDLGNAPEITADIPGFVPHKGRSSQRSLSRGRQTHLAPIPEPPKPLSRVRTEALDVAWSGYSKCLEPSSPMVSTAPSSDRTWRSSLSSEAIYERVVKESGLGEVKRQEIMWEMCETEQGFVDSMKTVLKLFAIPLKTPHGRWIEGIPRKITDLFDFVQSIVRIHTALVKAQKPLRSTEVISLPAFISTLQSWINQLAVHEPLILELEEVSMLIENHVKDAGSFFGEFVRMQMKSDTLRSMSLGSMLLKPVQRLTKYPLFLKGLVDATPDAHPSHHAVVSLLSATEYIIHSIQATKAREEDFQSLQSLQSRITNLPENLKLAVRGRRLLGQGQVVIVSVGEDELLSSPIGQVGRSDSTHSVRYTRDSISSAASAAPSTSRSHSPFDFTTSLTSSRSSAFSTSSFGSFVPPSRSSSMSVPRSSPPPKTSPRPPSAASAFSLSRFGSATSIRSGRLRRKEDPLTLLVFDDIAIFAQVEKGLSGYGKRKEKKVRIIEGGIGRVVDVKNLSGLAGHCNLFSVTLTPLHADICVPKTYYLTLPSLQTSSNLSLRKSHSTPSVCDLPSPSLNTVSAFMDALCHGMDIGVALRGYHDDCKEEVLEF